MTRTIVDFILLLIAHTAVGIYSSPLKYSKRTTFLIWGGWIAIQMALLFYTEFVMTNWVLQFFVGFILSLVGQYVIYFATTKGKVAQRLFTMLTYSIIFCIVMSLFMSIDGTFGQQYPIFTTVMLAVMLCGFVCYFLLYVCPFFAKAARNITTGWVPLIMVDIVFLITVIFASIFPVRLTSFRDPAFVTFLFLGVSIMSVYPVIFSNINSLSEAANKRELERQNKLLLAQIEAENAQLMADSQARHDRRHHNLVMLEFANNNDIESVREYLKNLVESESQIRSEATYCDNVTVNTVLTVYQRRAEEKGIQVKITANASRDLEIAPQDLVIVIANLFENAIHGAEKLKKPGRQIQISVKENAQRLLIKAENSCRERMAFDETHYGVGIRSVIATANRYDGMYDFSAEGGTFSAKVSLNLK